MNITHYVVAFFQNEPVYEMCYYLHLPEEDLKQQVKKIGISVDGFKRLLADMKPGSGCKL